MKATILKTAVRNLLRHKTQSFTAIFGLAFGLACLVPALCWMYYETSYDSFYPESKHIFRVYSIENQSGKTNERVPGILGKELLANFPEVEAVTSFVSEQLAYTMENKTQTQLQTVCSDSAFFRVFPQEIICGDSQYALQIAGNMVLTENTAVRLFGDPEKALGQKMENPLSRIFGPCTITAVIKDIPENTNIPFDAILNYPAIQDASLIMPVSEQWKYFNNEMYATFYNTVDIEGLAVRLNDFTSKAGTNAEIKLRMLPITDIRYHLNADLPFTLDFIRLLVAAGILLMVSALFNFLNLYTALFRQRIHEFRQRMIHGANSWQLVVQMMFETSSSMFIAWLLGGCLVFLARPMFSELLGIKMPLSILFSIFVICGILVMVTILLGGLLPYWKIVRQIEKSLSERKTVRQPVLQKMAVALQLAVSVVFIIAASVIMMQMSFVSQKDLGFNKDGVIQLYSPDVMTLSEHHDALMQQLKSIPQIEAISTSTFEPSQDIDTQAMISEVEWQGKRVGEMPVFQRISTDERFAETFGLQLLDGHWWNEGENNKKKIVLNEEAVRAMGLANPVGTVIHMTPSLISSDGVAPMEEYEIVGVINDFHTLSLRSRIYPTLFKPIDDAENIWYVRVAPGQEQEAMQRISNVLRNTNDRLAEVRLSLLSEVYDRLNYSEQAGMKLFAVLAAVSLAISLFGIYAVAIASTRRRRKEIAIRKIAGAGASDVVQMFFREYALLAGIAGTIALPVAYFAMLHWLQGYVYRTTISWWLLIAVVFSVVSVVLLTVLGQVLKAANSNPAEVIISER